MFRRVLSGPAPPPDPTPAAPPATTLRRVGNTVVGASKRDGDGAGAWANMTASIPAAATGAAPGSTVVAASEIGSEVG